MFVDQVAGTSLPSGLTMNYLTVNNSKIDQDISILKGVYRKNMKHFSQVKIFCEELLMLLSPRVIVYTAFWYNLQYIATCILYQSQRQLCTTCAYHLQK